MAGDAGSPLGACRSRLPTAQSRSCWLPPLTALSYGALSASPCLSSWRSMRCGLRCKPNVTQRFGWIESASRCLEAGESRGRRSAAVASKPTTTMPCSLSSWSMARRTSTAHAGGAHACAVTGIACGGVDASSSTRAFCGLTSRAHRGNRTLSARMPRRAAAWLTAPFPTLPDHLLQTISTHATGTLDRFAHPPPPQRAAAFSSASLRLSRRFGCARSPPQAPISAAEGLSASVPQYTRVWRESTRPLRSRLWLCGPGRGTAGRARSGLRERRFSGMASLSLMIGPGSGDATVCASDSHAQPARGIAREPRRDTPRYSGHRRRDRSNVGVPRCGCVQIAEGPYRS